MADRWPLANGSWSTAANWNGGTLPQTGDVVYADGKTIAIDQNVNVLQIRTDQRSGGTVAGGFTVAAARTIACSGAGNNIFSGGSPGTGTVFTLTHTTGTVTVTGSAQSGGGSQIVNFTGTGKLVWNGNLTAPGSNTGAGIIATGTGAIVEVNGTVTSADGASAVTISGTNSSLTITGTVTQTANNTYCVSAGATNGTFVVTGTVNPASGGNPCIIIGGTTATTINGDVPGGASSAVTISHNANAPLTINGNLTPGGGSGGAVYSSATSIGADVTITGTITAGGGIGVGSSNYSSSVIVTAGTFTDGPAGACAIFAFRRRVNPVAGAVTRYRNLAGTAYVDRFSLDHSVTGAPTPANVRQGTVYAAGSMTGTLIMPSPSSVVAGAPVGATVGTAALTPAAVWDHPVASITAPGSIGERLKDVATVDSTGDQVAAYHQP